jgi:hypothetical protein
VGGLTGELCVPNGSAALLLGTLRPTGHQLVRPGTYFAPRMAESWRQPARRLTRPTQHPYRQPGRRRHRAPRRQAPPDQFIEIGGAHHRGSCRRWRPTRWSRPSRRDRSWSGHAGHASSAVAHWLIEPAHQPGDVLVNLHRQGAASMPADGSANCPPDMAVSRGPTVPCRTPIMPVILSSWGLDRHIAAGARRRLGLGPGGGRRCRRDGLARARRRGCAGA